MALKAKLQPAVVFAVAWMGSAVFAQEPNMPATGPGDTAPSEANGFELGLRVGYGVPLGTAFQIPVGATTQNAKWSDLISGMIPFWADLGYRIDPHWYVGGFFQFGLGFVPSSLCGSGASCSENDLRFGLNVHYHFLPDGPIDPWVGLGAAYEIWNLSGSGGGVSASSSLRGFEFGNAQLGADYKLSPGFGVGPFVTFSVAQFSDSSGSVSGLGSSSSSISNKGIHEWLIFGLRGVYDFSLD